VGEAHVLALEEIENLSEIARSSWRPRTAESTPIDPEAASGSRVRLASRACGRAPARVRGGRDVALGGARTSRKTERSRRGLHLLQARTCASPTSGCGSGRPPSGPVSRVTATGPGTLRECPPEAGAGDVMTRAHSRCSTSGHGRRPSASDRPSPRPACADARDRHDERAPREARVDERVEGSVQPIVSRSKKLMCSCRQSACRTCSSVTYFSRTTTSPSDCRQRRCSPSAFSSCYGGDDLRLDEDLADLGVRWWRSRTDRSCRRVMTSGDENVASGVGPGGALKPERFLDVVVGREPSSIRMSPSRRLATRRQGALGAVPVPFTCAARALRAGRDPACMAS